ncbi:ankyrin-3-like [Sycon ciliatum]|uniref:ankyrin-3-like n=1 Tax=Sycon ciliatum TaxID=27933 RepID=UPI0020ACBA25|eukprot:scpid25713/ scgid6640/ Serine/threonine-protein kinase CTR1
MQLGSDREARIANAFVSAPALSPTGPGGSSQAADLKQFVQFLDRKMLTENACIGGVPLLHFMAGHARDDLVRELLRRGASVATTQQGLTPLHFAVSRDHTQCPPGDQERRVNIIRALVKEARCQVNAQELRGWTALKFAVRFRLNLCVQELINHGANADLQDQEGFAPLHNAIGAVLILRTLLPHVRHVDSLNHRKQTALIIALVNRDLESAELLLSANTNMNIVDMEGNTPLILATRIGNLKLAQLIIKKGANVGFVSPLTGRQALHYATESNLNDLAAWLVRHGADILAEDSQGRNALHLCSPALSVSLKESAAAAAVAEGKIGYVQRLVELGLDINAATGVSGAPLLHRAAYCGHSDLVNYLLQNGASVALVDNEGDSAIHYVCLKDLAERYHAQALHLLLAYGGDASLPNKKGDTPLHIAARQGFNHRVHMLLENGADRSAVNKRGELPLHRACGNPDAHMTVCMLLDGVPKSVVNRATEEGWTPLMYAAKAGAIEIASFLVEQQADVNVRQRAGFTALHFAVQCTKTNVRLELCDLLLQHSACPNAPAGSSMLTPLHWACANALSDVCKLLLEHGADPHQKDMEGDTSLALIPDSSSKLREALEEMALATAPVPQRQSSLPSLPTHREEQRPDMATQLSYDGSASPSASIVSSASQASITTPSRAPIPMPRRRKKTNSDSHLHASVSESLSPNQVGDGSSGNLSKGEMFMPNSGISRNATSVSSLSSSGTSMSPGAVEPQRQSAAAREKAAEAAREEKAREAAEEERENSVDEVDGHLPADVSVPEEIDGTDLPALALAPSPSHDQAFKPEKQRSFGNLHQVNDSKPGLEESLYLSQSMQENDTARAPTPTSDEQLEMLCLSAADLPQETSLGSGAYSDVYQSTHNNEKVAVKLFKNLSMDEVVDVFDKEVRLLSRLKHPNVLRFIGYVTEPGFYAIVTDLLERGSLYEILHNRSIDLGWTKRLKMMLDAALGMEYLHSCRMLHRDLKSMNLLVSADWVVKVADFGLTKVRMHTQTMASSLKGTPAYMAPELLDSKPISEATDVYAFGIIIYEVATRKRPYHEHTLNPIQLMMMVLKGTRPTLELSNDIPEGVVELAKRCWTADFRQRPPFREICEWLQALNACVDDN